MAIATAMSVFGEYTVPAVILLSLILFFITRLSSPPMDPREPPLVKSKVPIIGHVIGLFQYQVDYLHMLW
jgi:hypothetical protein